MNYTKFIENFFINHTNIQNNSELIFSIKNKFKQTLKFIKIVKDA